VKRPQNAWRDAPTQGTCIPAHFNLCDRSLFELDHGFGAGVANHAPQKVAQVRIVADKQNGVLAGMFLEQLLKVGKRSFRPEGVIGH